MKDAREWNHSSVRDLERGSIRTFVEKHRHLLRGRVMDFGCGQQPYKHLVNGEYFPVDQGDALPDVPLDTILCTQVLQYIPEPSALIAGFAEWLVHGGHLVMTYPTNWDEVEPTDLWRFTKAGVEQMLRDAGFFVVDHERRAEINLNGFKFPLGYGVVARI